MECLEKLLTRTIVREYATCDKIEPKFYTPLNPKRRLNLDKVIKDYSEAEYLVDEILTKMGINVRFLKDQTNFKVLDPYSFDEIGKKHNTDAKYAFILRGLSSILHYGKTHSIFIKEVNLAQILSRTFHEIGHSIYDCLPYKNCDKEVNDEIDEAFAVSFDFYSAEIFNILNYDTKFDINYLISSVKNDYNDEELYTKILKGLIHQFPTMKDMCLFLKESTGKEILEKAGLQKNQKKQAWWKNF